jgi:hypothetical protein
LLYWRTCGNGCIRFHQLLEDIVRDVTLLLLVRGS